MFVSERALLSPQRGYVNFATFLDFRNPKQITCLLCPMSQLWVIAPSHSQKYMYIVVQPLFPTDVFQTISTECIESRGYIWFGLWFIMHAQIKNKVSFCWLRRQQQTRSLLGRYVAAFVCCYICSFLSWLLQRTSHGTAPMTPLQSLILLRLLPMRPFRHSIKWNYTLTAIWGLKAIQDVLS